MQSLQIDEIDLHCELLEEWEAHENSTKSVIQRKSIKINNSYMRTAAEFKRKQKLSITAGWR